ncbi:hypothetical protein SFRURICE_018063, partial [Spodoptera frugiperda]
NQNRNEDLLLLKNIATSRLLSPKAEVHITARNAAIQCTRTFHRMCYKSHVIGGEPIAIYWTHFQTPCYHGDLFKLSKKAQYDQRRPKMIDSRVGQSITVFRFFENFSVVARSLELCPVLWQ